MGIEDIRARATAAQADADNAITRLHEYEDQLRAEMECNRWSAVSSDLLSYARGGKMEDFPARLLRAEAIRTVLMGIPNVILQIEDERDEILHGRNYALTAARRTKAGTLYKQKFREFEANYEKLSRAQDQNKFLTAAEELSRIAWESGMMSDLREHIFWKWARWHRVAELARF